MNTVFLDAIFLHQILFDRAIRIQDHRPEVHIASIVEKDFTHRRQRVGRGIAGTIRKAEALVLGVDEDAR